MDCFHKQMIVYCLSSGWRRVLTAESVHGATRMLLRPLIARGGRLPSPFGGFAVEVGHTEGGARFALWQAQNPISIAGLGWTKHGAEEMGDNLEKVYLSLSDGFSRLMGATRLPTESPKLPWLGIILAPGFSILAKD